MWERCLLVQNVCFNFCEKGVSLCKMSVLPCIVRKDNWWKMSALLCEKGVSLCKMYVFTCKKGVTAKCLFYFCEKGFNLCKMCDWLLWERYLSVHVKYLIVSEHNVCQTSSNKVTENNIVTHAFVNHLVVR